MNDSNHTQDDSVREQLSAFLDDELPSDEARFLLRRLEGDPSLSRHLARYAMIGEAVRGQRDALRIDLAGRVRAQLQAAGATSAEPPSSQGDTTQAAPPAADAGRGAVGHAHRSPLAQVAAAAGVAVVLLLAITRQEPASVAPPAVVDRSPTPVTGSDLGLVGGPGNAAFASYVVRHTNAVQPLATSLVGPQQAYDHLPPEEDAEPQAREDAPGEEVQR